MRARFISEIFKEESDPIKDMGIGLTYHIKNIQKALRNMKEPFWDDEDYVEDEYGIKLTFLPDFVEPDDFYDSVNLKRRWHHINVFEPFKIKYYIDLNLESNIAFRIIIITNEDIKNWKWIDKKILSKDVIHLTPEEIVKMIQNDWRSYDDKNPAIDAYKYAETNYEKTQKRIRF